MLLCIKIFDAQWHTPIVDIVIPKTENKEENNDLKSFSHLHLPFLPSYISLGKINNQFASLRIGAKQFYRVVSRLTKGFPSAAVVGGVT